VSNQTALLVLDAQVNMFAPEAPVYAGDVLLQRLAALIDRARAQQVPVVYIQNNGGEGDPDQPGTPGWQIHPAVAPRPGDIVLQKGTPDAFHDTPLQILLAAQRIRRLVIAGLQTDYCIDATCRQAEEMGYDVTLAADAHSTYDSGSCSAAEIIAAHNEALARLVHVKEAGAITYV
jgi:nicotinamidase-related amidase